MHYSDMNGRRAIFCLVGFFLNKCLQGILFTPEVCIRTKILLDTNKEKKVMRVGGFWSYVGVSKKKATPFPF